MAAISGQLGWKPDDEFDAETFGKQVNRVIVSPDAVKVELEDKDRKGSIWN